MITSALLSNLRRLRLSIAAVSCVSLLAACGGGGTGDSQSGADHAELTATAQVNNVFQATIVGNGTLTFSPSRTACQGPGVCTRYFAVDSTVTITATAASGSTFSSWTGNCTGKNPICTVGMQWPELTQVYFTESTTTTSGPVVGGMTDVGGPYPWPTWTKSVPTVAPSTSGKTYYVDGTNGSDSNAGTTVATAFKTIAKSVSVVSQSGGDTVLIKGGLYREGINLHDGINGSATKLTTFGAYGNGEVILDISQAVTGWTQVSGSVYKASYNPNAASTDGTAGAPVGVVINDVPLKQVTQGQRGSSAPQVGIAGVTSGSGMWGWNSSTNQIYADFGSVAPATADVVVPNSDGGQYHVYFWNSSFLVFNGLTVRGSGSNGIWGYGHDITVINCNIKFNAKAAVSFQYNAGYNYNNSVITTHAYQNVLLNWPRGNNGFAENGGGWAGNLVWSYNYNGLARGNIVHDNGGEGILSYGSLSGVQSGSTVFEQNVAFDNWSVNLYFDNQPNDVARQNFLYNHPTNTANFLYYNASESPWNTLAKYSVCAMLADEQGSSNGGNGYANLANTQVYNNIFANCRIGIRDYAEGSTAIANHGLKNTLITNNTIVMYQGDVANSYVTGIYLQNNGSNNSNSLIENNVVYGFMSDTPVIWSAQQSGPLTGITLNHNAYFGPTTTMFSYGYDTVYSVALATWQSVFAGADTKSVFANPLLIGVSSSSNQFFGASPTPYSPTEAALGSGSPAAALGTSLSTSYSTNFAGTARGSTWTAGAY